MQKTAPIPTAKPLPKMHILTGDFFTLTESEVRFLDQQETIWNDHMAACPYRDNGDVEDQWRVLVMKAKDGDLEAYETARKYGTCQAFIDMMKLGETARSVNFHRQNAGSFVGVRPLIERLKKTAESELADYLNAVGVQRKRLGLGQNPSDDVTTKLRFILNECTRLQHHEPSEFERPLSDHLLPIITIQDDDADNE